VAYYVPLGPRGLLIGAGTCLLRIWGGLVYEVLRRRRASTHINPSLPVALLDLMAID
jgi:hypothetical protein